MLFTVFLAIALYINIVVVVVDIITITAYILGSRSVVDLRKRELRFVIYKGLEGFKDCNIIRCLAFIYQIEVQLGMGFLDLFKQDDLYEFVYDIQASIVDSFSQIRRSVQVVLKAIEFAYVQGEKLLSYGLDKVSCCLCGYLR